MAKEFHDLYNGKRFEMVRGRVVELPIPGTGEYVVQVLGLFDTTPTLCDECKEEGDESCNCYGESNAVEISVVRDNVHGRRSWGWPDDNKIILARSGNEGYSEDILLRLVKLAHTLADDLNDKES